MKLHRLLALLPFSVVLSACLAIAPAPTATPIPVIPTAVPPSATPVVIVITATPPPTATAKPKVNVPLVMNQTPDRAVAMLTSAGFQAERVEERSPACSGLVSKQEPFTGVEAEVGSVVKIYYCVGPTPTLAPSATPMPTSTPLPSPTATQPPDPCNLQPGQAGAYLTNNSTTRILVTIGGGEWGTHDYWAEPKSLLVMTFPPGRYTTTITMGRTTYKFAADRVDFTAGRCIRITGSWWDYP